MPVSVQSPTRVCFAGFELDLASGELKKNGKKVALSPKAFEVLRALAECPAEVVTRDELRAKLWAADTFVEFDDALNHVVNKLRQVLGDSAENPRFIETLPRYGYRLIAPIETGRRSEPASKPPRLSRPTIIATVVACISLVVAAALLFVLLRNGSSGQASAPPIRSLAVLPLSNLSGDPQQDYFADGMTDALITDLAKLKELKVISRTSVMQFKDARKPLPEIARALGVDGILEGSVQRAGGRVRVTVQLIHAPSDTHIWAESYERDTPDILSLQGEVAQAVAREIKVALTPEEQHLLAGTRPVSAEAYEAYLKGKYHHDKGSVEDIKSARQWFQRAIEKDPDYASAYAGLAWTYTLDARAWAGSVQETYETARSLTQKAIALDGTLAEAHMVLADIKREYDWDWPEAEAEFKKAIRMNPNYAYAHARYAALLSFLARHDEAIKEANIARELDPVSPYINGELGFSFYWARRYDQAIEQFQKTLELDRNYVRAYSGLGRAYLEKGMRQEALSVLDKGILLFSAGPGGPIGVLGYAYGALNQRADALKIAGQLEKQGDDPRATFDLARVYTGLGDKDRALEFLQRTYEQHYPSMESVGVDPQFDPLRSDRRFQDLIRRMNFQQSAH